MLKLKDEQCYVGEEIKRQPIRLEDCSPTLQSDEGTFVGLLKCLSKRGKIQYVQDQTGFYITERRFPRFFDLESKDWDYLKELNIVPLEIITDVVKWTKEVKNFKHVLTREQVLQVQDAVGSIIGDPSERNYWI